MRNFSTKSALLAIALLTCHGCVAVPVPIPIPISISSDKATPEVATPDCLDSLPNILIEKTRKQKPWQDVEAEADKLEEQGKGQEALNKYSAAHALYFAELDRTQKPNSSPDEATEASVSSVESPEFFFKIGRAFAKTGKHQIAISCFDESLSKEIEPPNDARAYLNRGYSYSATGNREKAREDYQQSADLFRKYKLPQYRKEALDSLKSVTP